MAGIMDRLSRLIRANINDLIDNAEDPEKMIDQILRDMQESTSMARPQVAAMIAQEKELELDAAETKNLAEEWGRKAERAVTAGKVDRAPAASEGATTGRRSDRRLHPARSFIRAGSHGAKDPQRRGPRHGRAGD